MGLVSAGIIIFLLDTLQGCTDRGEKCANVSVHVGLSSVQNMACMMSHPLYGLLYMCT